MKRVKIIISILLAILLYASSCTVAFAEGETSGECGDGVTWNFDSATGELTIDGSGRMSDFSTSGDTQAPWYQHRYNITKITIGAGVKYIGVWAFYQIRSNNYDKNITLNISEGVEEIGACAFERCQVETLNLPSSLKTLSFNSLYKMQELKNLTVSSGNTEYVMYDGALYTSDYSTLILYPIASSNKTPTVKSGCTTIGRDSFSGTGVTSVTIPSSVTAIEESAFSGSSITSVEIPSSVKTIGESAFHSSNLKSLALNEGLETISATAFNTSTLETVSNVPSTVKSIGHLAFSSYKLTSLTLLCESCTFPDLSYGDLFHKNTTVGVIGGSDAETYVKSVNHEKYIILCKDGTENHSYEKTSTTATCTEAGKANYTCSVCGATKEGEDDPALGHEYEQTKVDPTCTEQGYTSYKCTRCGDEYQADFVDALGHTPKTTVVKEAAVGVTGLERTFCEVCGVTIEEKVIPALPKPDPLAFNADFELFRVVAGVESAKVAVEFEKDVDGYEIYVAKGNGDFKKRGEIKSKKKNYCVFKNLKGNQNYKFKLRAYKKIDGKKHYSKKYSKKLSVRIKKY